jgi:hypothetical protein
MMLIYGIVVIAIIAGLFFVSMLLSAVMSVIGGVIGAALAGGAVIAWIYLCWCGYRANRKKGVRR